MGEIYAAHDERLDRLVALKVISPQRLGDAHARELFTREARAAARLSHPFICKVYEVTETSAGEPVIVMEYVRGETVQQLTSAGLLAPEQVIRYGREIAEALAAAHAHGVVHRDISAGNVMIAADGHVKLMDFGLARVEPLTSPDEATASRMPVSLPAAVAGTPPYIAPEVLGGAAADVRSDLYAVGVVLYRMATGQLPFADRGEPLLARVLTRPPVPPRVYAPALPWALERVILHLLEKEPQSRIQTAEALMTALNHAARGEAPHSGAARAVAVLPFRPLGHTGEELDLGIALADATITDLAGVRALLVRPTSAILPYQSRHVDALTAGRELSVDAVVEGSFQRLGTRIRVTVQLITTADGRPLWGTKIDQPVDDVFSLQDEVSRRIVDALEVRLSQHDEERLGLTDRHAGAAHEQYLRGRVLLLHESLANYNGAVEAFERAIALAPSFAPAHAGLARAYWHLAFTFAPEQDCFQRAIDACDRALAIDPDLPEGRLMRGRLAWTPRSGFRHADAIRETTAAIAARPGMNEAHSGLGVILLHVSMVAEAIASFERAIAIDPKDDWAFMHLGYCWFLRGDWQKARELADAAWHRAPSAWAAYQLALAELHLGRTADSRRTIDRAARQFPGDVLFHPLNAVGAALAGDTGKVHRQVELVIKNRREFGHYHHAQYDVACALSLIGEREESVSWLEQASHNGFPCHSFFELDPWLAAVRHDDRFSSLMIELRRECEEYRTLYVSLMRAV
jgi:TolB-like protein/Tfp pilus assembly protein PilF